MNWRSGGTGSALRKREFCDFAAHEARIYQFLYNLSTFRPSYWARPGVGRRGPGLPVGLTTEARPARSVPFGHGLSRNSGGSIRFCSVTLLTVRTFGTGVECPPVTEFRLQWDCASLGRTRRECSRCLPAPDREVRSKSRSRDHRRGASAGRPGSAD